MFKKIVSALCMTVSIILTIIPSGMVQNYFVTPMEKSLSHSLYFDIRGIGGENFINLLVSILSIISLALILCSVKFKKITGKTISYPLIISIVSSIVSRGYLKSFTYVSLIVTVLHIIVFSIQLVDFFQSRSNENFKEP